jgi:methylthioribulose-1-phosphate dehydratase
VTAAHDSPEALASTGRELAAEASRFAELGWMRGTSGNLSAVVSADPLRLAVTASGLDKGTLTASDIVVVDRNGQRVASGPGPAPSAEAALHARIAAVTGAGAVAHVHTIAAVAAGRRWPGGVELADLEMLKGLGLPAAGQTVTVPVISNSQDMKELGDRFEQSRQPGVPGLVVADHGLYAWGPTLLKTRHHTEILQWLLELAITLSAR